MTLVLLKNTVDNFHLLFLHFVSPATPEKPPEPQHEETVCSGEEVLPVCRAANWGMQLL